MNNEVKSKHSLGETLRDLPQVDIPRDIFPDIQNEMLKTQNQNSHKFLKIYSVVAIMLVSLMFFRQISTLTEKDELIEKLVARTVQLEQLLANENLTFTDPGSIVTERIINMEAWLVKLDQDIQKTKDRQELRQLISAKVNLLNDIVQLQRSVNNKPDFQKVKPFII